MNLNQIRQVFRCASTATVEYDTGCTPTYRLQNGCAANMTYEGAKEERNEDHAQIHNPNHRLRVEDVCELASSMGYCEIAHDPLNYAISFLQIEDDTTSIRSKEKNSRVVKPTPLPARINVYYSTGTVAVCHMLHHEMRQVFLKRCTMKKLSQIFARPPQLTLMEKDAQRDLVQVLTSNDENYCPNQGAGMGYESDLAPGNHLRQNGNMSNVREAERVKILRKKIELADVAYDILLSEQEELRQLVPEETIQFEDEEDRKRIGGGLSFAFSLNDDDVNEEVQTCLDCRDVITCVATNGRGLIVLYGKKGRWKCTSNIPVELDTLLRERERTLPPPRYVSLGSQDRYYVRFEDGEVKWVGSDNMEDCLNRKKVEVRSVTFGSAWDSFFIVFEDGTFGFGEDIPRGLLNKLKSRKDQNDLACVSLGENSEWFLRATNGNAWWGGLSVNLYDVVQSTKGRITSIDFGENDAYFLRYCR